MSINIIRGIKKVLGIYHPPAGNEEILDCSSFELSLMEKVSPHTMTSKARCISLMRAVDYLLKYQIEGDFVECGVWKGGSVMIMAEKLLAAGKTNRNIYLYDTFEGMSEPTDNDKSFDGKAAAEQLQEAKKEVQHSVWCYSTLEEVRNNVLSTGYPESRIHFVKGKVEDTIPTTLPGKIALLRLDTDWYESTKHELEHLFPLLVPGGIIIIDDYGHWEGCRRAVDEYFEKQGIRIFLSRIDYTGRIGVR